MRYNGYLLGLTLSLVPLVLHGVTAALERIITHGHLDGQSIKACPSNTCTIDTSTRLYFWIAADKPVPNMYLQSGSNTLVVATNLLTNERLIPTLSRALRKEIAEKTGGNREMKVVEAIIPASRMEVGIYTFLICIDRISWLAVDMTCVRAKRFLERFRKGERLLCNLDKKDIRRDEEDQI